MSHTPTQYTLELTDGRPVLMCEVCLRPFHGEDDVTDTCNTCGREGFCRECAEVTQHDCVDVIESLKAQNAVLRAAAERAKNILQTADEHNYFYLDSTRQYVAATTDALTAALEASK